MEPTQEPLNLPNPSAKAGFIIGLELCSKVLWETANRIKDDPNQGYSERLAVIVVLREIHDQIKAEMEKINGDANKSPRVNGDSQERQQASE